MALNVRIRKKLGIFQLDVDFEVKDGIFAILGASGCGKSMTLKCIAGIETPDQGRIVLNGKVLYDSEQKINLPPQKRKVGYMFQDYALFPNMSVAQNIMAGMGKKPEREAVMRYLEQFHLVELASHYPSQLSGGQKQRVAMARMIASKPDIILLDEPFSALDSYLKWELEQQMRETLQEVQKPALFVSHNRDEVYRLCNMVSCIHQGRMEVIEPIKEFFHNPKTREAARLSGCKNISDIDVIDAHHIYARNWDVTLYCKQIPADTVAIGIRAHSFDAGKSGQTEDEEMIALPVMEHRVLEEPFEWNISWKPSQKSEWLQWKIAKKEWGGDSCHIPEELYFHCSQILFLKDGTTFCEQASIEARHL